MRSLFGTLCLCLSLLGSRQAPAAESSLWIDVRSPEEFAAGHLPAAINLPYQQVATRISQIEADKTRDIHLYCGIGVRAQAAKFMLEAQGYTHVTNEGGYAELAQRLGQTTGPGGCGQQC